MAWLTDPLELEFMQRALLEIGLLAAPAGLLGTWIVLRRLAFFTHAAGSATFPGLVVAGPWGIPAQLAAFGAGLLYAGGLTTLTRRARFAPDAATGLLLVAALAGGTILASDIYESGGGVDRLLFGTLLGLDDGDLLLSAAVALLALAATAVLGRTWLAAGFDPGAARPLGISAATGDAALLLVLALAVVAALPAVGALLVGTLLVLPAATARLLARSVRELQLIAIALVLLEGTSGLLLAFHLDLPPGPAIAVLGGAAFALAVPLSAPMIVRAEHLEAGYGTPVIRDVEFAAAAGQTVAVLAPNGGGKTTLFRTLLGELPPLGGTFSVDGTLAAVHQHDHARLDFPVSALDVALMGAYGRTPWWRRLAGADRSAARGALDRVGLADREDDHFGSLSGGQRRRVMIARAIVQDARVLLLDEPFAGVDRASEERILTVLDELAAEGRTLLVATHDVEQSRRWDRVLCLNGRQIAFGTPEETLTAPTLAATYGPELVVLREGRMGLTIQHHDHGDDA